jgi:hypothetical protein
MRLTVEARRNAAVGIAVPDGLSALAAVRHGFLIIITLRFLAVFRQYGASVIWL